MNELKVLHISRTMGQGGAEKIVFQLCSHKFDRVTQMVASTGGHYSDLLNKGYQVKQFKIPDVDSKNPVIMFKTFFLLIFIVIKYKINVVHTHHRMAAFYARIIKIVFRNLTIIYTAHNVFNDKKQLTNFALRKAKIISVGDSVKKNLCEYFKINGHNVKIIYNSVDVPKTMNKIGCITSLEKNGIVAVGFIGRLTTQKGVDTFIKAIGIANEISSKNIHGFIVGDGEKRVSAE